MTHIVSEESQMILDAGFWRQIGRKGRTDQDIRVCGAHSQIELIKRHFPNMDDSTQSRALRTMNWLMADLVTDAGCWK